MCIISINGREPLPEGFSYEYGRFEHRGLQDLIAADYSNETAHVLVRKRKFDGYIKSQWEGELLFSPKEEWLVVLHNFKQHRKYAKGKRVNSEPLFLHCLNVLEPVSVLFEYDFDGWFRGAKCDAALPATIEDNVIEYVDLDLDLMVAASFSWRVRDEDTFARNCQEMGYTERVIQQARAGINIAQVLVESRSFPFDNCFIPRLGAAVSD